MWGARVCMNMCTCVNEKSTGMLWKSDIKCQQILRISIYINVIFIYTFPPPYFSKQFIKNLNFMHRFLVCDEIGRQILSQFACVAVTDRDG